jgi:hypothetical protein
MRRASGSKPVGETSEVLLVDGVQHLDHRPLEDLVFQRGDPERSKPPVRFWYEHPASRPRPVSASVNPGVQIPKVVLEILPVFPPRHPVHPGSRVRAKRPIRLSETVDGDVMQKRGEPHIPIPARQLAHTVQVA